MNLLCYSQCCSWLYLDACLGRYCCGVPLVCLRYMKRNSESLRGIGMWKWHHGSVTDDVASPSAVVGCMLQDVRNARHIFQDHKECPVETGCCGRT